MKVAIMGAGLSGLACALTLEKFGIEPTIFEKRRQVGDRFVNGEVLLSALYRPIKDPVAYLSERYNIHLQPIANLKSLVVYSHKEVAQINGNLGFLTLRGRVDGSLESQLAKQVQGKIIYNSTHTYEQLLREFTHIVLAPGDAAYATKLQDFQVNLTVTLKGATVTGNFNPYSLTTWFDYKIIPLGYGYLIPFSKKEANLVIGYPDYPTNQQLDIDNMWDIFYQRACEDLGQNLSITDRFEVNRYIIGLCRYPRIGNTFFVGNCFGSIMPFFGFGQYEAILTGIYAAHDLCGLGHYNNLTKELRKSYTSSLALRRTLEQLDNHQLDILVNFLNGKVGQMVANYSRVPFLKLAGNLLKSRDIFRLR